MKMIVAMTNDRVIGLNGNMPWGYFPADLRRFKRLTLGSNIIVGRKTYESLPFKPLLGRTNIVVSRDKSFHKTIQARSLEEAASIVEGQNTFVIGGAAIYEALSVFCDELFITEIHANFPGDTFFYDYKPKNWLEVSRKFIYDDFSVDFDYSFVHLTKRPKRIK